MGEFSTSTKGKTRYTNNNGVIFEIEEKDGRLRAEALYQDIGVGWSDTNIKAFARYLESFELEEEEAEDSEDSGDEA